MTATGVSVVLIIGTKDLADPESAPHYVLARSKPFLLTATVGSRYGLSTATSILGLSGQAGAFSQVSRFRAAASNKQAISGN